MMKILAIETSGSVGGVALLDGARVLGERLFEKGMFHGRDLAPSVEQLSRELALPLEALDLIAVDIGPGSYTGLRVGLAAAKGLCLALDKPILGVVSLDAMAENARDRAAVLVPAMDAKWEQIYGAVYRDGARVSELLAERPEDFATRIPEGAFVFGDALEKFGALLKSRGAKFGPREIWHPKAAAIGRLGARAYAAGERPVAATLVPLYLRPTEAELKFGKKDPLI